MNIINQLDLQEYREKLQHIKFEDLPKSDQVKFDLLLRQECDEMQAPNFTDDVVY